MYTILSRDKFSRILHSHSRLSNLLNSAIIINSQTVENCSANQSCWRNSWTQLHSNYLRFLVLYREIFSFI